MDATKTYLVQYFDDEDAQAAKASFPSMDGDWLLPNPYCLLVRPAVENPTPEQMEHLVRFAVLQDYLTKFSPEDGAALGNLDEVYAGLQITWLPLAELRVCEMVVA